MKHWYLLLFILFGMPRLVLSQETPGEELVDIIPELSKHFEISFSYIDELIQGKQADLDYHSKSLEEVLNELEQATRLKFEMIDQTYVLVRPFTNEDMVSICGYIRNQEGAPLIGVSIGTDGEGTYTDEEGYFQIDSISIGSVLRFSYVGYGGIQRTAGDLSFLSCPDIVMRETLNVLEEVVVQNYTAPGILKSKNAITVNPQQLRVLSGLIEPDVLQSIQFTPGVNSPFETASGLYVRGGLPDQNLVLWNGIQTYNQGHFFGMISAFNPYITEEVKFIKNGTSARYGGRVSSVIDMKTSQKVADRFSGGVGSNLLYGDAFINVPVVEEKVSVQLSGRRSFTDGIETITYNQFADRVFQNTKIDETLAASNQSSNTFYFNDLTSNVIWQVDDNNRLIFNSLYSKDDLNFSTSDASGQQAFNDLLLHANEGYMMQWLKEGERLSFDVNASNSKYLLKYEFISTQADTAEVSSKKNLVTDYGFQLNTTYQLDQDQELSIGYQFTDSNIQYAYETATPSYELVLDADNSRLKTHSIFTEYRLTKNETYVSPGLRLNHYADLGLSFFEPRLYIERAVGRDLTASVTGEYRTQSASQIKESVVSDLSLENKVWALASEDRFPIIRSYQFTVGANLMRKGWLIDLEAYRKQVLDVTTLTFGFLNPDDNQFRLGDSRIIGSDLFVKKVWSRWESWLSYSYIRTENTFQGLNNNQPFPGSWNIEHTVRSSNIFTLKEWEFALGWTWHTGKSFTDVVETPNTQGPVQIFFSAINANNLPDYHRLDLSATYEIASKKNANRRYRIGLSLLNVYNRRNLLNREFRTTPSLENELIDTRVYSLGITPNLVFRLHW